MAISSYNVLLVKATGEGESKTYTKVIDIKDFPDLGGSPEMLETTTLSDKMQTYIPGIQSSEAMEFTCNYTLEDFKTLQDLSGKEAEYGIFFGGTDGPDGKFVFNGIPNVFVSGGGVNEVVSMTLSIAPTTPVTLLETV